MRTRKYGFTLIELLVVIAIIAILAAILMPVFAKARNQARLINRVSNIKQVGLAIRMYADENGGGGPFHDRSDPVAGDGTKFYWQEKLHRAGYGPDPDGPVYKGSMSIPGNRSPGSLTGVPNGYYDPWWVDKWVRSPSKVLLVANSPPNLAPHLHHFWDRASDYGERISWCYVDGHAKAEDKKWIEGEYMNRDGLTGVGAWWSGYWGTHQPPHYRW